MRPTSACAASPSGVLALATEDLVIDLIYLAATALFFALMLLYVAACDRLGRKADVERSTKDQS